MTASFHKVTWNNCVCFSRWTLLKHSQHEPKDAGQEVATGHHPDDSEEGAKTASASPNSTTCATHRETQFSSWTPTHIFVFYTNNLKGNRCSRGTHWPQCFGVPHKRLRTDRARKGHVPRRAMRQLFFSIKNDNNNRLQLRCFILCVSPQLGSEGRGGKPWGSP